MIILTDSNPLTYLLTTAKLDATSYRWLAALSTFFFNCSTWLVNKTLMQTACQGNHIKTYQRISCRQKRARGDRSLCSTIQWVLRTRRALIMMQSGPSMRNILSNRSMILVLPWLSPWRFILMLCLINMSKKIT